jgi:purine-binding chemotaxis protein CheW
VSVPATELAAAREGEAESLQFVVFSLAGCECAVGIRDVREIDRVTDLTLVPRAPRFVEGVLNLRGRVVPVLDLRKRFDMPLMERTEESRILITDIQDQWVGLWVDRVVGVVRVPPSALLPQPSEPILSVEPHCLKGRVPWEGRLILLLDLERLLTLDPGRALPEGETA